MTGFRALLELGTKRPLLRRMALSDAVLIINPLMPFSDPEIVELTASRNSSAWTRTGLRPLD
jgi:hypothetical protein